MKFLYYSNSNTINNIFFIMLLFALLSAVPISAQSRVIRRPSTNYERAPIVQGTPTVSSLKRNRAVDNKKPAPSQKPYQMQTPKRTTEALNESEANFIDEEDFAIEVIEPSIGSVTDEIAINFESVDLMSLVRYLSQETGRGFVIHQPLQGNVTIISPITLNKEEALAMLESILQARGYTAVASGKMFRIMQLTEARVTGTVTRSSDELQYLTDDDTLITQITPLNRTSIDEASKILQNLLPRDCSMLAFPPSNTIVLTGRSISIKKALEVLTELETSMLKPDLDIIPLQFSLADEMKGQLEQIISKGGVERDEIRGGVSFVVDKRNNAILVLSSKDNFTIIRALVTRLDTSSADSRPEITQLFSLKYANERETVNQLEEILGLKGQEKVRSASESVAIDATRLTAIARTRSIMVTTRSHEILNKIERLLTHLDMPPEADASDIRVIRIVNAEARVLSETLSRLVQQKTQNTTQKQDTVSFVAEEHTNSIIMTGPAQQFAHYETIIRSLDLMRPQILVEILITEVSGQLTHTMGIEWNSLDFSDESERVYAATNYGLRSGPLSGTGFQVGYVKDAINPLAISRGDLSELSKIRAMVKAYRNNSDFNILSAPQILATDNEEARISVGEVVALPQGFTQDRDTGRFDLTNFKYEDVGIVLSLTPRVNSEQQVTLKIKQEIKKRQEENLYEFNVPVLTKREMDTTITVPNSRTIVIGGLMSEDETKVVEKVPFLSKLPLLGKAFQNKRTVKQKTNLLVFLTPHILSTPDEVANFGYIKNPLQNEAAEVEIKKQREPECLSTKAREAFANIKKE